MIDMLFDAVAMIVGAQLVSHFVARAVIRHLDRRDDRGGV